MLKCLILHSHSHPAGLFTRIHWTCLLYVEIHFRSYNKVWKLSSVCAHTMYDSEWMWKCQVY